MITHRADEQIVVAINRENDKPYVRLTIMPAEYLAVDTAVLTYIGLRIPNHFLSFRIYTVESLQSLRWS